MDRNIDIQLTDDMDMLNEFFEQKGLEISEAEPVETNVVKAWKATYDKKLVGGVCLAYRENAYIIDGIATDETVRGINLGKQLLDLAIDEVITRGGDKLFLVARAPGFFRKQGFVTVADEEAPLFYECATCPQFRVSCQPEIMCLNI